MQQTKNYKYEISIRIFELVDAISKRRHQHSSWVQKYCFTFDICPPIFHDFFATMKCPDCEVVASYELPYYSVDLVDTLDGLQKLAPGPYDDKASIARQASPTYPQSIMLTYLL